MSNPNFPYGGHSHQQNPYTSPSDRPGRNTGPRNTRTSTGRGSYNVSDTRHQDPESSHSLDDFDIAPVNEMSQSYPPDVGFGASRSFPYGSPNVNMALHRGTRNDRSLAQNTQRYTAMSPSESQNPGAASEQTPFPAQQLGSPLYGQSTHSRDFATTFDTPYPQVPSNSTPQEEQKSLFEPFGARFSDSDSARTYRKDRTRFGRKPHRDPESDPKILEIENNRQYNVERIYNAMTRSDLARDNKNSIAMKRWTVTPHYRAELVEAFAHKVFDCLLEQAKEGFRGWHHNDYVSEDRKGEHVSEDRDVDCAARLDNVVSALAEEKTICEDVMNSACQIRMFVNAPRAYANRKQQNRMGNSKRGRTKDGEDTSPKSSKSRKTSERSTFRPRSSTTSTLGSAFSPRRRGLGQDQSPQRVGMAPRQPYSLSPGPSYDTPRSVPRMGVSSSLRTASLGTYPTHSTVPARRGNMPASIPPPSFAIPTSRSFVAPTPFPTLGQPAFNSQAGPSVGNLEEAFDLGFLEPGELEGDFEIPAEWGTANLFEQFPEAGDKEQ